MSTWVQVALFIIFVIPIAVAVCVFLLLAIWMSINEDIEAWEAKRG